jgi:hypothetical protein
MKKVSNPRNIKNVKVKLIRIFINLILNFLNLLTIQSPVSSKTVVDIFCGCVQRLKIFEFHYLKPAGAAIIFDLGNYLLAI